MYYFYRYVTAATTAASGYSYWHYGRKTVRVLNTRSPWQSNLEAADNHKSSDEPRQKLDRRRWQPGAAKPSSWDNQLWFSVAITDRIHLRLQMAYWDATETSNCSSAVGLVVDQRRTQTAKTDIDHQSTDKPTCQVIWQELLSLFLDFQSGGDHVKLLSHDCQFSKPLISD